MSNPIEQLLNQMIQNMLPQINSGIQNAIRQSGRDPWGQVANGNDNLGSIDLGICDASANANYYVGNMQGLSSFSISSLVLSQTQTDPNNPAGLVGAITVTANLGANLSANVGGGIEASCGFLHPSVGIGGSATVSGVTGSATGSFVASVNASQACLNSICMRTMAINYNNLNVNIDGLGIFNVFLSPLVSAITGLFQGQITSAIAGAVTPILNTQINAAMPQCTNL